jgi:hypothetical protein
VVLIFSNNKAQIGLVRVFFLLIIFVLIWGIWLGRFINEWVSEFLKQNYVTGIEAFLWANMNLWIGIMLFIGVLIFVYSGAYQR